MADGGIARRQGQERCANTCNPHMVSEGEGPTSNIHPVCPPCAALPAQILNVVGYDVRDGVPCGGVLDGQAKRSRRSLGNPAATTTRHKDYVQPSAPNTMMIRPSINRCRP